MSSCLPAAFVLGGVFSWPAAKPARASTRRRAIRWVMTSPRCEIGSRAIAPLSAARVNNKQTYFGRRVSAPEPGCFPCSGAGQGNPAWPTATLLAQLEGEDDVVEVLVAARQVLPHQLHRLAALADAQVDLPVRVDVGRAEEQQRPAREDVVGVGRNGALQRV